MGGFEVGRDIFVLKGENIPELFKCTNKSKSLDYKTHLGYKMNDGRILPMITNGINDTQVAIVYTYSRGNIELKQIIRGY
jgi:hypothetical protein